MRLDISVISDEADRSQYDTSALKMNYALPNLVVLDWIDRALIVGEEKTNT